MSTNVEITGRLEEILEPWENDAKTFKKQEFIIFEENERNAEYPDYHKFQLTQAKCDLIDKYAVGDILTVSANMNGKKWEKDGKTSYFTSLGAWKIHKEESSEMPEFNAADMPPAPEEDDLPF